MGASLPAAKVSVARQGGVSGTCAPSQSAAQSMITETTAGVSVLYC